MEPRIQTLHPQGKAGVNISRAKYDVIRAAILRSIGARGVVLFNQLGADVRQALAGQFEGSISWYVTTVKLDLEARGVIERVPGSSPQQLRLPSQ